MGKVVMRNLPGGVDEGEWRERVEVGAYPHYLVRADSTTAGVPYATAYVQILDGDEPAFIAKWDALRWVGSNGEVSRCSVERAVYQGMPLPVEEQEEAASYGDTFTRFCRWKRGEVASMTGKKKGKGGKTLGVAGVPSQQTGPGAKLGKKTKEKSREKGLGNASQLSTASASVTKAPATKAPVAKAPVTKEPVTKASAMKALAGNPSVAPPLAKKSGGGGTKKRGDAKPGSSTGPHVPLSSGKTFPPTGNTQLSTAGSKKPGLSRKTPRDKSRSAGTTPDPTPTPKRS